MGTRSVTKFIEQSIDFKTKKVKKTTLAAIYRQYDGYPSGHGKDLADFLKAGKLVNGIGPGQENVFNGIGCLAAQVIKHLKDGPGGLYITSVKDEQEFNYEVIGDFDTQEMTLIAKDRKGKVLFKGHPKDFDKFLEDNKD